MRYGLIATESDDPGHLHLIWGWLDDFLDGTEYIMAADTGLGQAAAGYIVNRTPGAKHTTLFKPQEKIELGYLTNQVLTVSDALLVVVHKLDDFEDHAWQAYEQASKRGMPAPMLTLTTETSEAAE